MNQNRQHTLNMSERQLLTILEALRTAQPTLPESQHLCEQIKRHLEHHPHDHNPPQLQLKELS